VRQIKPPVQPTYNVLLIEEDLKQTELHSDLIREVSPDCQVDVLSRVESSFDWVENFNYHLIVIDASSSVGHPSAGTGDGLALLERIKRMSPVTSVIVISDNATVEEAVAAIRLGAEDYLKKPFSLESFQLAVKRGLDRKAIFGSNTGASSYLNLLNSCQMVSASLEQNKIFGIIQSYFSRELRADHSAVYTLKGAGEEATSVRVDEDVVDERKDRAMEEVLDIALHASNPLPKMVQAGEFFRFIDRGQLTPGLFVFRFHCAGEEDFFCVCLSPERPAAIDAFEGRLRMLKAQIEVTGRNITQYIGVQNLAYVDDATGLYNTRYLNTLLDREIAQSKASNRPFAILFMDADKFKSINDTHGHLVGTKLLNELGAQLKNYVRGSDTVFRYGGDEFVAVLSGCDLPTAQAVAERIRQSVEAQSFIASEGLNIKITVTIGVALFPEHADSKRAIIEAADHAMYKVVVSDFHLGKGRYFRDGTQNILEDFTYDREFSEFLNYYRSGSFADADVELVFNGDILNLLQIDTWGVHTHLITERSVVRAIERIVAGHPEFFQALRRFAATPGHTIVYIVGNHDSGMLFPAAKKAFAAACGAPVNVYDVSYQFDGIYIEHGQQYERFACTDMQKPFITRGLPEPVLNLPWGSLFVAVMLPKIKQERPHVDKVRPFQTFVIWSFIHDIFWSIKTIFAIARFVFDTILFRRRYQIGQGVKATMGLLKEISLYPSYDKIAFRILEEKEDVHTVIFGHTHILRYRQWREGKEYFNEGSWNEVTNLDLNEYGTRTRLTYAFIEYPIQASSPGSLEPGRPKVRMKEWKGVWKPEMDIVV
jgi:diguanylate cyclase (GGDEF)-like protein